MRRNPSGLPMPQKAATSLFSSSSTGLGLAVTVNQVEGGVAGHDKWHPWCRIPDQPADRLTPGRIEQIGCPRITAEARRRAEIGLCSKPLGKSRPRPKGSMHQA